MFENPLVRCPDVYVFLFLKFGHTKIELKDLNGVNVVRTHLSVQEITD